MFHRFGGGFTTGLRAVDKNQLDIAIILPQVPAMAISEATRRKLIAAQKARRDSEKKTIEEVKPAKSLAPVGVPDPVVPVPEEQTQTSYVPPKVFIPEPFTEPFTEAELSGAGAIVDAFAEWLETDEGKRASDSRLPSNPMRFRAAFLDSIEIAFKAGLLYAQATR